MSGNEMIKLIQENGLGEMQLIIKFMEPAPASEWGITYRQFDIAGLDDIGHLDGVAVFGITEQK